MIQPSPRGLQVVDSFPSAYSVPVMSSSSCSVSGRGYQKLNSLRWERILLIFPGVHRAGVWLRFITPETGRASCDTHKLYRRMCFRGQKVNCRPLRASLMEDPTLAGALFHSQGDVPGLVFLPTRAERLPQQLPPPIPLSRLRSSESSEL